MEPELFGQTESLFGPLKEFEMPEVIPMQEAPKYLDVVSAAQGELPDSIPIAQAGRYLKFLTPRNPKTGMPQQSSRDYTQTNTERVGNAIKPTSLPIEGRITQGFGVPQAVKAAGEKIHAGVDIAVPVGTPIPDKVGGTVIGVASPKGGYGKNVLVKGDDGITRRYSHLSEFRVKVGDKIKPNTVIGLSGNTGASTGPHLDFRIYQNR